MCNSDTNDLTKVQAVNSPSEAEQPAKTKMFVCQLFNPNAGEWPLKNM